MVKLKKIISGNGDTHLWHFSRVGGVNRVNLELIDTEETSDTFRIFADRKFNGDCIITEDSAVDELSATG
jgi:hypothetical protein